MKPLSRPAFLGMSAILAVVMIATRFKHFGDTLHLPDASMALFFLGGLFLRRHVAFIAFVALAVLLDWVSISYAGVSDFCITVAYSFLPLAYAVLWYGGRFYSARLTAGRAPIAFGIAALCAVLSFAISNGSFYWFGGRYAEPNFVQYVARLWQWGPLFVRSTLAYVAVALVMYVVVSKLMPTFSAIEAKPHVES
jgi:hypothetical protein